MNCCTNCSRSMTWKLHSADCTVRSGTQGLAENFVCTCCLTNKNRETEWVEELSNEVETVDGFCKLGDQLSNSEGCLATVTARVWHGWENWGCVVRHGEMLLLWEEWEENFLWRWKVDYMEVVWGWWCYMGVKYMLFMRKWTFNFWEGLNDLWWE